MIVLSHWESRMQFSKLLALVAATAAGSLLLAPVPSHAQQGKTSQNVRSTTTPALSTKQPYVRPVAANTRDHRGKTGVNNTSVTPSAIKRQSSPTKCLQSVLGGPCVSGRDVKKVAGKVVTFGKGLQEKPRDHRK